ncbi:MAG: DUF4389 domain-containing protein [Actinobacteria bacterium]|nr:DUF4389 domain-containing protein [Actinomycetota bacterium]
MAASSSSTSYPVNLVAPYPERSSRGWALLGLIGLKYFFMIPHGIVLMFVIFLASIVVWLSYLIVLITGRYPRGLYNFALGTLRWQTRVSAWLWGLADQYSPFSMQE